MKLHDKLLNQYIEDQPKISIFIYSLIYFLIVSFSIPVATLMTLIGGFLFGQNIATICVVLSASFGACIIFMSTKIASKTTINSINNEKIIKLKKGFNHNAFTYMLTLRLIPFIPFVLVNLISGFLQIPLKIFFFGTLLGIIPASYIYVSLGVAMNSLLYQQDFSLQNLIYNPQVSFALSGLGFMAILPIIYNYFYKK